jgi:hypothetical protein
VDYLYLATLPPATAQRGRTFEFRPEVRSAHKGVTVSIAGEPKGMAYDKTSGAVRWAVPNDQTPGVVPFVLRISDETAQVREYKLDVRVD